MKIHHLRSATFVIESNNNFILVDPMLGKKGSIPPFAFFRHKPRKNPYVSMPANSTDILSKVTHAVITHLHPDHLDAKGYEFLKNKNIPVTCNQLDKKKLIKKGLNVVSSLEYQKPTDFLKGKIIGIPARHGYGFIAKPMGNVMGFYIELPDEPSIYISSDTIYTNDVENTLVDLKPDISVLAAGSAQFDIGGPLLMNIADIAKFITNAPNKVYANHMEAVNHCPTDRNKLKQLVAKLSAVEKVIIPGDGESFELKS
ncbi:MBL fold metallo-hydrolase [Ancylomarina longa]|uniref:MBL fold metallo-hydrolase n=1 Tax=Ancylomarina longa TaxID=2487017 RepID=A0A434AWW9_9BACT|nr:MBL fold metallo-hydrolase [Ancylomarina longa]RUT78992.1 MBL fold metallo-hydrolase [Ancylomarina longa]